MTSPQNMPRPWSNRSESNPANDDGAAASTDPPSTTSASSLSAQRTTEWVEAHEALARLAQRRAALDAEEGPLLLRALRSEAHRHLGYGSFFEYAERVLGYTPRTTDDKLRTAGLDAARGRTVRQIERLVLGRTRGDRPSDVPLASARRHILRFDVAAETLATFREAMKKLRQDSGERLDDDDALLLMARHVLGGSGSAHSGRSSYQLAVVTCEHCGRGFQEAAGQRVEVKPEIVDMARCDAQCIGHVTAASPCEPAPPAADTAPTHVGQLTTAAPSTPPPPSAGSAGQGLLLSPMPRATQTIPPRCDARCYGATRSAAECPVARKPRS